MGISGSFMKLMACERFERIFVNNTLRQGSTLLKENASHRDQFVEFVKSESWKGDIADLESISRLYQAPCSIWGKYGYKEKCPKDGSVSSQDSPPDGANDYLLSSKSDPENAFSDRLTVFTDNSDANVLLVAVLYPIFASRNFHRTHNDSVTDFSFSSRSSEYNNNNNNPPKVRQNRLQYTLLALAANIEAADLKSFLTDDDTDFIDEYYHAIVNLPVRMMLCQVHKEQNTSPVSFANFVLHDIDKVTMGLRLCEQEVIGQDLHVLYGNMCSPGGARQLERAVFAGKTYKQRVELPNGHCKLLAICPVHSSAARSAPFCTVSLESEPFPETRGAECWEADQQPSEVFFQQIEDVVMLLPLLIKA
jgi:hypothetical protein